MPFSMLQAALGLSFLLLWLFIGGMVLSDRLAEVRNRRARGLKKVAAPIRATTTRGPWFARGGRARRPAQSV